MNLYTKQKKIHSHRKQTFGYQRGKDGGEINQEFGINIYTLLNNKDILYSTGNYTQYFVITYSLLVLPIYIYLKNSFHIHIYTQESFCCIPETNTTLQINYISIEKNMKRTKTRARVKSKRSKSSVMDWAECYEQPSYLLLSKSTEQSDL